MDDQNPQTQQGGGTNPGAGDANTGDTTLPWMNFSPDATTAQGGGATGDSSTAGGAQPAPASGSFDPFGNPFASTESPEDAAAAFAPKTEDGSLTTPTDNTFTGTFVPSEPSAFTPTLESAAPETPAETDSSTPDWMNGGIEETEEVSEEAPDTRSQNTMETSPTDSLSMLNSLKAQFEEEEATFNQEVEEHNLNIQYEKDAIDKLRAERSERLTAMRKIVRGLDDLLGIRRDSNQQQSSESKNKDHSQKAPRRHDTEPRKAERTQPKKKDGQKPVDDFLAA